MSDFVPGPDGPSSKKKITLIGIATAAICPGLLWLSDWARENPWLVLPAVALWELFLVGLSFALAVWSELRSRFVKRAADRMEFLVGSLFSQYRRNYLQDVIFQHRNFDIKGLSTQSTHTLELEHVFVDLSIAPIVPHEASADMLCNKLPEALREGRHTVWDFLQADGDNSAKLAVLGGPGSGKTTLLKHVALTFAAGRSPTPWLRARHNVPILLFLREHAAKIIAQPSPALSGLIAEFCKEKRARNVPPGWFDRLLAKGRCVVMFDGLDEVDPEMRNAIVAWAERQMSIHARNRFVVTSRPHGYRNNPLNGVSVLSVRPFSWPQVKDFVHKWYVATEVKAQQRDDLGVRTDGKHGADDLLDRLHRAPALADLAVNPLLLTMIATVHRFRSSLPGRRVELYAEICEVSLGKRQHSKGLTLDLTPAQKQRVLEPLAWRMMSEKVRDLSKDDASSAIAPTLLLVSPKTEPTLFLNSVENDSSLLLEREGGVYAFAHLTFQEFLAACHARQQPDFVDVLVQNVGKSWWRECLHLFAATGDATTILQACMRDDPPDPEALALAIECREEAKEIDPNVRTKLDHLVETGLDEMDPIKRRPVAEAMLKVRVGSMHRLDEDRYIDRDLVTNAEYQLFLEELRIKGEYRQPDHWTGTHYVSGQGRKPVVGLRFSDTHAFCAWLTDREGGPWRFRPPTDEENAAIDSAWETHETVPWRLAAANSDAASQAWPVSIKARQSALIDTALNTLTRARFDLDRTLTRAHDLALARAGALAGARTSFDRDLAGALAGARTSFDRDLDRDLDRAGVRLLPRNLDRDFAGARTSFDRDLDRDLAGALAGALTRTSFDRDLDRDLDRAGVRLLLPLDLDRAGTLGRTLDRARDFALDLVSFDLARAGAGTLGRTLDRRPHGLALARAGDLVLFLALALDLPVTLDVPLGLDLAGELERAGDLGRTLDRARDLLAARVEMGTIGVLLLARDLDKKLHQESLSELYRFLSEYSYLICILWFNTAANLLSGDAGQFADDKKLLGATDAAIFPKLIKYCLGYPRMRHMRHSVKLTAPPSFKIAFEEQAKKIVSCYVLATFKNSRIKGDHPPFEALRLVKEKSSVRD